MRYTIRALLVLACVAGEPASSIAASPSVVELFTSQGCNSCPPADALLGELARRPEVIPLAFHVDYWDGPTWRDRFAIPEAARRQASYVATLGLSTSFTPQAIVDGRESLVGLDRRLATEAAPPQHAGQRPEIPIELRLQESNLLASLPATASRGTVDVNLVTYLSAASTSVRGGENGGRKLDEFNIVRSIRRLASWDGTARTLTVALSELPRDADHAVVLIQQPGPGLILAAAAIPIRQVPVASPRESEVGP